MTAPPPLENRWGKDVSCVALIGYRGAGKSTIGGQLSAALRWSFADTDREVENRLGQSIPEIFAEHGEPCFRDAEAAVLADLAGRSKLVLATGGGAILRESNRQILRSFGLVVWLRADPEVLAFRIARDGASRRPALTNVGTLAEIEEVLAQREPIYESLADMVLPTDRLTTESIIADIRNVLNSIEPAGSPLRKSP